MLRVKSGLGTRFFSTFKKKIATKSCSERQGIMVFDEIPVRKEMGVSAKTMTYAGLVDFGETANSLDELSDHGLVFTFRAFGDCYSLPVAAFASKGPTKGTVLTQLVVKSIVLLENAGVFVGEILCDGAATNRAMWKQFCLRRELTCTRNSFVHPLDDKFSVHVLPDEPLLVKRVRNGLLKQKVLRFNVGWIMWAHYEKVYAEDTKLPGYIRGCAKLTFSHMNLSNTEKLRVKLATQVFSRSVAKGLEYYSSGGVSGLQDARCT
ncbi:hypothetical protein HPB48_026305 [Haemaphysalis longicornis]|uniref:Transposase n=1 Tax=Haemaphysalis longicornis TaxID=44386 RepID=A0A9J6HBP9_HAELO|nr:hypothetical protein HPB48_026305 [Haemaphysalis longicornis]